MTDFALVGKKGTGKSKNAVRHIRDFYLRDGRAVASNLDLDLCAMFGPHSRKFYVRVPDKPTAFDLDAIGHGNPESYDEDRNGGLFLDELGTWMNTRSFADKSRLPVLDWLAHARKHGWDCFYIMQSIAQVDKQLRESFIEFTVRHVRFDKVRVPLVGSLIAALFGPKAGYLPRFHRAVTRLGCDPQDLATDSAFFRGDDLNACYDTRQVFREGYPHGTHCVLSPWHVKGRYMEPPRLHWAVRLRDWLRAFGRFKPSPARAPVTRPEPGLARVLALSRSLPADDRLWVVSRYVRSQAVSVTPRLRSGRGGAQRRLIHS